MKASSTYYGTNLLLVVNLMSDIIYGAQEQTTPPGKILEQTKRKTFTGYHIN